jgi:hypothetical protein
MANQDAPFGLTPIRSIDGSDYDNAQISVCALSSYDTNLFVGDPVKIATGSNDSEFPGYFKPGTLPAIEKAAAGDAFDFVITAFRPNMEAEDFNILYGPASTKRTIEVVPVLTTVFEIQESGAITAADVGKKASINGGSGSTVTGISGVELDSATIGTGTELLVLGLGKASNNSIGDNAVWEVMVSETNTAQVLPGA